MIKSTLGLDFARSCSVKHGLTSAVFSLEMSKSEIVMRLLSAEARILWGSRSLPGACDLRRSVFSCGGA